MFSIASDALHTLRHPLLTLRRALCIDFDFDGGALCDDESVHADLVELFERREVPSL